MIPSAAGYKASRVFACLALGLVFWILPGSAGLDTARAASSDTQSKLDAGEQLLREGHFREALAAFLALRLEAPDARVQRRIAESYRGLGAHAKAYQANQDLLDRYGDSLDPSVRLQASRALDELAPVTGALVIKVPQPGAQVIVDGESVGTTPLSRPVRLDPGTRTVEVSKPGFTPVRRALVIGQGTVTELAEPLQAQAASGQLVVTACGEGPADLVLDGRKLGPLPWKGTVVEGEHEIAAEGLSARVEPTKIKVLRDQLNLAALTLAPFPGTLHVRTLHAGATIRLDGAPVGTSEWTGPVGAGTHELSIEKVGFLSHVQLVRVAPRQHVSLDQIQLVAENGEQSKEPESQYPVEGLYVRVALLGLIDTTDSNDLARSCPPGRVNAWCSTTPSFGGGAEVRIGRSFLSGLLAPELFALAPLDVSLATVQFPEHVSSEDSPYYGVARREEYVFFRYGGGAGLAARVTSKTETVRVTGSLGLGALYRAMSYAYASTAVDALIPDVQEHVSETLTYLAPVLVGDVGVTFGHTTGAKLYAGGWFMLEMTGTERAQRADSALGYAVNPLAGTAQRESLGIPAFALTKGPQFFIGPIIGMRFGS